MNAMALRGSTITILALAGAVLWLTVHIVFRVPVDDSSVGGYEDPESVALFDHLMRADGFEPVDAAGLRAMLDHTFYNIDNEWIIYYGPKGEGRMKFLLITFPDGSNTDTGQRKITRDGRYCTKWKKNRGGARRCGRVWKKGDLYYGMLKNGYIGSKYRIKPGNPEGL